MSKTVVITQSNYVPWRGYFDQIRQADLFVLYDSVQFTRRDWRNYAGKNYISGIRDQGNCGSCVAFGTAATLEAQARIEAETPAWGIDLSEAELFYCSGQRCSDGWWPSYALDYVKGEGIASEACFEYEDHDMACNQCDDRASQLLTLNKWYEVINGNQRKQWLDKHGPMVACLAVYEDFYSYKSGVYKHVTGNLSGYHCVSCVGYDETEGCWICKNSWGADWGDKGFFKIAYHEAEMDTRFAMYGVEGIGGTLKPETEEEVGEGEGEAEYVSIEHTFATNQSVVWAKVCDEWRHATLTPELLDALGGSIFASDTVEARFNGDQIVVIRGVKKYS